MGAHTALPSDVLKTLGMGEKGSGPAILPFPPDGERETAVLRSLAAACVYMADKLTPEDSPEPVRERFARVRDRVARNPEALAAISRRETLTLALEDWFTAILTRPPLEQIRGAPPDGEEDRLAALSAQPTTETTDPCRTPSST